MGMRRGHDNGLLFNDNGEFMGVNLGADFCAEHEWGIKGIKQSFGLNENAEAGIARHQIHDLPLNGGYYSYEFAGRLKQPILGLGIRNTTDGKISDLVPTIWQDEDVATAWSENTFAIRFHEKNKALAKELNKAFENGDISFIFLNRMPNNPFSRSGLCVVITSRLPQSVKDDLRESHLDSERLQAASDATGIKHKIDSYNRDYSWGHPDRRAYFALSPSWKGERFKNKETKYDVVYWLNPQEQGRNNCGWFTVEELEQWLVSEGPIPKKKEAI